MVTWEGGTWMENAMAPSYSEGLGKGVIWVAAAFLLYPTLLMHSSVENGEGSPGAGCPHGSCQQPWECSARITVAQGLQTCV